MKRIIPLLLVVLFLCGCAGEAQAAPETTLATTEATVQPTTEETTEPTTVPTEPEVYMNPLNGEILDEPYTGRIYAHMITNTQDAMPHVSENKADIVFEAYMSRGVVRNVALFTDIASVEPIGGTRSTRILSNQIAQIYDAILIHGGGFDMVLDDARYRELDHFNVDSLYRQGDPLAKAIAYRDKEYRRYAPNDLFTRGPAIVAYVESQGVRTTQPADKEYNLSFVDDGTPLEGENADEITCVFGPHTKTTTMVYDEATGKYIYKQYGQLMVDQVTGDYETFDNVIIMDVNLFENYIYQEGNFATGGRGYYASGGKLIPIDWECDDGLTPFRFLTKDGEILNMTRGNTYIAIVEHLSWTEWVDVVPPPETEPVETTVETVAETTAETVPETTAAVTEETTTEIKEG